MTGQSIGSPAWSRHCATARCTRRSTGSRRARAAPVHIDRFARALFDARRRRPAVRARRRGPAALPARGRGRDRPLRAAEPGHLLERAAGFGARLGALLDRPAPTLELVHFRDPWSGIPIVEHPGARTRRSTRSTACRRSSCRSCTRPSRRAILERVAELEQRCLDAADVVITPSEVTAAAAAGARRRAERLHVVRNGAEIPRSGADRRRTRRRATSCTSARCSRGRASTRRCARSRGCATSTTSSS